MTPVKKALIRDACAGATRMPSERPLVRSRVTDRTATTTATNDDNRDRDPAPDSQYDVPDPELAPGPGGIPYHE